MTSPAERTGITIVSLFRSHSEAEAAIRELKGAGFTDEEIGVVKQDMGQRSPQSLGVSAPDAEYFERGLRGGGILLTVNAGQRTSEALAIIGNHGADLGPKNRRIRDDPGYSGPERRFARV